jgi:hypothetical protein
MTPVTFPEVNTSFGPPPDLSDIQCSTIPAYIGVAHGGTMDGAAIVVTAWQPTAEELADLNAGKPVLLTFIGGLLPHMATTAFTSATSPR